MVLNANGWDSHLLAGDGEGGPRDLVIISTNTPCGGCTKRQQLQKICNAINSDSRIRVQHDRHDIEYVHERGRNPIFRRCYFLYTLQYRRTLTLPDVTGLQKHCFVPEIYCSSRTGSGFQFF